MAGFHKSQLFPICLFLQVVQIEKEMHGYNTLEELLKAKFIDNPALHVHHRVYLICSLQQILVFSLAIQLHDNKF